LTHYNAELVKYKQQNATQEAQGTETTPVEASSAPSASLAILARPPPPEAPLSPNSLKFYKPTVFGLDKARRDCRFEMIKIVREVSLFMV